MLIKEHIIKPLKKKFSQIIGFFIYTIDSSKKKFACKIKIIEIKNQKIIVHFSVLYKQQSYQISPKGILEENKLILRFSSIDSAIIGMFASQQILNKNKNEIKKLVDQLKQNYPDIGDLVHVI